MNVLLLAVVLLAGCAAGEVIRPDGTILRGAALGHARLEVCPPGVRDSPAAALLVPCTSIEGGALSTTFVELVSTLAALVASLYTGGLF